MLSLLIFQLFFFSKAFGVRNESVPGNPRWPNATTPVGVPLFLSGNISKDTNISLEVSKEKVVKLNTTLLENHQIETTLLSEDLKNETNEENIGNKTIRDTIRAYSTMKYRSLSEIYSYIDYLARVYYMFCQVSVIGTSNENRPIKMVTISGSSRPHEGILIDAAMLGRDWSSVSAVLYFMDRFLNNFHTISPLVQSKTWFIIPVLNPDGYEYSYKTDNLWQKNRKDFSSFCRGVNIDANIDFFNCHNPDFKKECNPHYCGSFQFSEPESQAFMNAVKSVYMGLYLSIRSGEAKVVFPERLPGVDSSLEPSNMTDAYHMSLARDIAMVMSIYGVQYKVERVKRKKSAPGSSLFWIMDNVDTDAAYIISTRGDSGSRLSDRELWFACAEVFEGIMRFARMIN